MARELLKMAEDDNVADSVKLTAIRDALDRGGVSAKTEVDVSITAKPFEQILDSIESSSRAEFRRSMGIDVDEEPQQISIGVPPCEFGDDDDGYGDDDLIVDGEVIDAEDQNQGDGDGQPITHDGQDRGSDDDSAPFGGPLGPNGPAGGGMMPLTEAVAAQAEMRKHATLRPIQRALPRGRT